MSLLFSPFTLRGLCFRNRVFVSPMCQYSTPDGVPGEWHLVHLGSRAVGGAGAVFAEATAVSAEARISPGDTGLYNDEQERAFGRLAAFIRAQGAVAGIQLAHAGRKASTDAPWRGGHPLSDEQGGWEPVAPSPLPFSEAHRQPRELTRADIAQVVADFRQAAERALRAGFQVVEIHAAHGYLLHQFLSPFSNRRSDEYGQDRPKLTLEVARAVRACWPEELPVFTRISATDWKEGGWDVPQSVALARDLKEAGVDLVDCSSGGIMPGIKIPNAPGYQVPFAESVRQEAGIATGAVGLITEAHHAEEILQAQQADVVFLARGMLDDPYWALHAAEKLGAPAPWPDQYLRARSAPAPLPTGPAPEH